MITLFIIEGYWPNPAFVHLFDLVFTIHICYLFTLFIYSHFGDCSCGICYSNTFKSNIDHLIFVDTYFIIRLIPWCWCWYCWYSITHLLLTLLVIVPILMLLVLLILGVVNLLCYLLLLLVHCLFCCYIADIYLFYVLICWELQCWYSFDTLFIDSDCAFVTPFSVHSLCLYLFVDHLWYIVVNSCLLQYFVSH